MEVDHALMRCPPGLHVGRDSPQGPSLAPPKITAPEQLGGQAPTRHPPGTHQGIRRGRGRRRAVTCTRSIAPAAADAPRRAHLPRLLRPRRITNAIDQAAASTPATSPLCNRGSRMTSCPDPHIHLRRHGQAAGSAQEARRGFLRQR